jgi:hypothetical protein
MVVAAAHGDPSDMTTTPPFVRFSALAAPILLLLYGLLRLADGMDGAHGPGLAWSLGHTLFLVAFVLLGVVVAGLRQLVPDPGAPARITANVATAAGLVGVACFLWVILGDLFPDFDDALPAPDAVRILGPMLFQLGTLTLLVILATVRPRRLPAWSPVLVLVGFVLFALNLDLIPVGAMFVLAGLYPLAREDRKEDVERDRHRGPHTRSFLP